jgi:ABC-type polysaccharide/polyol phosphate export permease
MLESLREIWHYRPLILELVRRDLKLRYKNSIGGIAWSLLNPLMQVAVITVVMKFILPRPIENYSAYLLGVLFAWNLISISLQDGCISILQNALLVRKIYFPRAILPLATLLGNIFHFSISFGFTILYFFALRAYPDHLRWEFLWVIPTFIFMAMLSLGLSYFLAYLNVFYEDVRFIVTALTGLFFYALPIFYPIEAVQAKGYFGIYMLNPVAALLVMYQRALLGPPAVPDATGKAYLPSVDIPEIMPYFLIAGAVSFLVLVLGFSYFERNKWEMVERL